MIKLKKGKVKNISLEKLISELPGHVYWKDLNGIYLGCNAQQLKSAGRSHVEDMLGKTDYDLLPQDDAERVNSVDMEVIKTGKERTCEEVTSIYNGQESVFLSQKKPLRDEQGNIIGIVGISFDITSYKLEQIQLKNQTEQIENRFETLIARMPGHVYWKDSNAIYLGCNDLQAKSLGLSSNKQIVGNTDYDFSPKDKADSFRKTDMEVMETKKAYIVEEVALYGGKESVFLSQKVPLFDKQGTVTGILGVSFDITERKRAEERLIQALEAKKAFLSIMSHELGGSLGGVLGFLDLLEPELESVLKKKPRLAGMLDLAKQELEKTLGLVSNVRHLLTLEDDGQVEQKQHETDIRHALQRLINTISFKAGVETILEVDKNVSDIVWIDILNLDKALQIVLENAARFTTSGHVTVKVKSNPRKKNHADFLSICVEDTGPGIDPTQLKNLFTTFVATEALADPKTRYAKVSVRLPIARKVMELIGGTLDATSRIGAGTKMTITVSYRVSKINRKKLKALLEDPEFYEEEHIEMPSLKILLVEDELLAQTVETEILERMGHTVVYVSTGLDAIEKIKSDKFDLVFLDITLSDIDGTQVADRMRALRPELDIVAVTSHLKEDDLARFLSHGILTTIPKPATEKSFMDFLHVYAQAMREED
jgi:two-component system aerobic respiration control sensor histidine kinase ArcB